MRSFENALILMTKMQKNTVIIIILQKGLSFVTISK